MQTDLVGRVKNTRLPITQPLLPMLEAVSNSLHGIEDRATAPRGRIDVFIVRDLVQQSLTDDGDRFAPIMEFKIRDDGVGFTDENFNSFLTSDTTFKVSRGGKGIGRFIWLKAFQKVSVDSVFEDRAARRWRRTFDFANIPDGITNLSLGAAEDAERRTEVRLIGLNDKYQDRCPRTAEQVARHVVEHFLIRFASRSVPDVVVHDNGSSESINLNQVFDERILPFISESRFSVGAEEFSLQAIHLHETSETEHRVHLCANEREVKSENLKKRVPELSRKLRDVDGRSFVVSFYVTGEFLDRNVSQERTDFYFERESESFDGDPLSRVDFETAITQQVRQHLEPYISEILREKREDLERVVKSEMPEYRVLLRPEYRSAVDSIPANLSKQELEVELHRALRDQEVQLKRRANSIKMATITSDDDYKALADDIARFIEEENEIGKANLAKYIAHRYRILVVFDRFLKLDPTRRFKLGLREI